MKIAFRQLLAVAAIILAGYLPAVAHETAIAAFLNRIGGDGAADKMVTVLDPNAAENGRETFVISSEGGKPKITGSSLSAITTGIGWYLNHHANINLAWNRLTTTFPASLPAPAGTETHECRADYRYYLNYCTFSYSMSTYTWDRWQKEIDWMALHGINMPLQIIGLDVTWYKLLTEDYGYSPAEANAFIAGPCFQAWWGMNNLEGWGGPNPEWWYERQAKLAKQVIERERELGIEPVLPGFAGMVPTNFQSKTGISTMSQGNWCGFTRPFIINPNDEGFVSVAEKYYQRLHEVMGGPSEYYSMDPFHEGANTSGIDVPAGYHAVYEAMEKANPGKSKWVAQMWQFSNQQWSIVGNANIPKGRLIMLDLYSDGSPGSLGRYNGHDVVWCALPNFGARTGFFGRFNNMISGYFNAIKNHGNIKGIGATPEGIEQTPVVYDILFELPWHGSQPDAAAWMADYTTARYGEDNEQAKAAWENLRMSALNNTTSLQGPHEAIICSRPALTVNKVSSWGGADIFYDTQKMYQAAYQLLNAGIPASNENYSYDLTDIARQALTDYSKSLLASVKEANDAGNTSLFNARKESFLQLILDIDELLNTNPTFMLGHWTELARQIADEIPGTTTADRDWLEKNNARTLISTWGERGPAESGGLRDYSYREWGGMLKDYYYQRWKIWFDNGMKAPSEGWFNWEWNWAHNNTTRYPTAAIGQTLDVANKVLPKYITPATTADGKTTIYLQRNIANDATKVFADSAYRGIDYAPVIGAKDLNIVSYELNLNGTKTTIDGAALNAGDDIKVGKYTCTATFDDGTTFAFNLTILEDITEARQVSVASSDETRGTATIVDAKGNSIGSSVNNADYVVVKANPKEGFEFASWTDSDGNNLGSDNPMTYYGKNPIAIVANFIPSIWNAPSATVGWTSDQSSITDNKQWLTEINVSQGKERVTKLLADEKTSVIPSTHYIVLPKHITAAPGGKINIAWNSEGNGLNYTTFAAFIDLNANGSFEDEGELIVNHGVRQSSDNTDCRRGNFDILLPYDIALGRTHIRIRIDGGWLDAQYFNGNIIKPDSPTNRFVYELILDVVESPDYEMSIAVKSNDPSKGSVDTNVDVATAGETIIMRAQAEQGIVLDHWEDQYGRTLPAEWMDGMTLTFKPFDDIVATAIFRDPDFYSVDGYEFEFFRHGSGVAITGIHAQSGRETLDFTQPNTLNIPITAISDGLLASAPVKKIILDGGAMDALSDVQVTETTEGMTGNYKHKFYHLSSPISASTPFELSVAGAVNNLDDQTLSASEWGNGLLATGDNALASGNYSKGFQLYLHTEKGNHHKGQVGVKIDGKDEDKFNITISNEFNLKFSYDGSTLNLTLDNGETSELKTFRNVNFNEITTFSSACGESVGNLSFLFTESLSEAFAGNRNLTEFEVASPRAIHAKNGVLYDMTDKVIAFPEGRLFNHKFRLSTADGKYLYVNLRLNTEGKIQNNDEERILRVNSDYTNSHNAIWSFDNKGSFINVNQINAGSYLGSGNQWGFIQANNEANSPGDYAYTLVYGQDRPAINLHVNHDGSLENVYYVSANGTDKDKMKYGDESTTFFIEELTSISTPLSDNGIGAVAFPVSVVIPDSEEYDVNVVTNVETEGEKQTTLYPLQPGWIVDRGEGLIITRKNAFALESRSAIAPIEFEVNYDKEVPELYVNNILQSTLAKTVGVTSSEGNHYVVDSSDENGMKLLSGTEIDANTPYLDFSQIEGTEAPDDGAVVPFVKAEVAVMNIVVNPDEVTLQYEAPIEGLNIVQQTVALQTVAFPSNAANQEVSWSSNNEDVATVSENGIVTPTGIGEASIIATLKSDETITATASLKVTKKEVYCTGMTIQEGNITLVLVQAPTQQLSYTFIPLNTTERSVAWSSSNEGVATVSQTGLVTAVADGEATISLTNENGKTASIKVTVKGKADKVEFTVSDLSLFIGDKTTVTTIVPDYATDKTVKLSTPDTGVISIDGNTITAVGPGTATITATTVDGATAELTVVVDYPQISIGVSPSSMTLAAGFSKSLRATVLSGYQVNLAYESSDESVVTVSNTGKVTAVAPGTATITVTATDAGGNSVESHVNVVVTEATVSGEAAVAITPATTTLAEGATTQLAYTLTGCTEADVASVSWTTTDGSIITIDADGTLHGIHIGTASVTLTVTLTDGTIIRAYCSVAVTATTGIDSINADAAAGSAVIFDLAGRRLQRVIAPGVYIVNGVKTMVR